MAAPVVRGVGASGAGTTSFTAAVPTGGSAPQSGDAMYIIMESSDSSTAAGTPNTPSGWSKLYERTILSGATNVSTLTIFGKIAGASEANVTVDGVGDHCLGWMLVVAAPHGVSTITDTEFGTAHDELTGSGSGLANSMTVTADSLVVAICGSSRDVNSTSGFNTWANSNLSGLASELAERTVNTGAGGGVAFDAGSCAGTTTGDTTWNMSSTIWQSVHMAIPPDAGGAQHDGSFDFAIVFGAVTSGTKNAKGSLDFPITFGAVTSGTKNAKGALDFPITFGAVTSGTKNAKGSFDFPITFGAVTAGGRTAKGSFDFPITFGVATAGGRTAKGSFDFPITFGAVTAASKNAKGSFDFPIIFGVTTRGTGSGGDTTPTRNLLGVGL